MKKHTLMMALALACGLLPFALQAAAPNPISGIAATLQEDGTIRVTWPSAGSDIGAYRVYFSQQSILENDGYYDDVETTDGPVTEHTLAAVPDSFAETYIAVMAVNSAGEESGYFVEEVRVARHPESADPPAPSAGIATAAGASSAPAASGTAATLRLVSAQATSATRVELTFSLPVVIDPQSAPAAFSIIDGMGTILPIQQLTLDGTRGILQTERQVAGTVYQIRLADPLAGAGGAPLDPVDRMSFFTGHAAGRTAEEARQAQNTAQTSPGGAIPGVRQESLLPDVVNYRLEATPQSNQLFTVIGQWEYDPATPEGTFIVVRQSRDGGRTFGKPEFLPRTVDGVRIPNVKPEYLGLAVYVVNAAGGSSPGILKSVFAWNTPTPPPAIAATVIPQTRNGPAAAQISSGAAALSPIKSSTLPQTGAAGIAGGLILAGAALGWRKARKMKKMT